MSTRLRADHSGRVAGAYPDALILGEELSPESSTNADVAFVVDPLDGTTNFLHGYPEFAVSIAAAVRGELVAAVIIDVPAGDRYTAIRGGGALKNGEAMRVSTIDDPARALIGTGFPFDGRVARAVSAALRGRRAEDGGNAPCGLGGARSRARRLRTLRRILGAVARALGFCSGRAPRARGRRRGDDGERRREVPLDYGSLLAGNPDMHRWLAAR